MDALVVTARDWAATAAARAAELATEADVALAAAIEAQPFLAGFISTLCALAAVWAAAACCCRRPRPLRGFGSGENSFWNRRIRTDRPVPRPKHYKLEHPWCARGGVEEGTATAGHPVAGRMLAP